MGESFHTIPGGKGANQAVAAARLGADMTMIGCVGQRFIWPGPIEAFERTGCQCG